MINNEVIIGALKKYITALEDENEFLRKKLQEANKTSLVCRANVQEMDIESLILTIANGNIDSDIRTICREEAERRGYDISAFV